MPDSHERLPLTLSIYLDLVRFSAAIAVVLSHAWPELFPSHPLPWPGHDAVVVFFVLSGLVIANATNRPGLTLAEYTNHRLARVWSVALPALILSGLVSLFLGGRGLGDAGPAVTGWFDGLWRIVANLSGIAQMWSFDISPPLDAPFWSLNFEIWYYAIFGAWVFLNGRHCAIVIAVIGLVAGPKIMFLFPVWLLGVWLHRHRSQLDERTALAVLIVTIALALIFIQFDVSVAIRHRMFLLWPGFMASLRGASQFVGDMILGIIVVANFTAAASLGRFGAPLRTYARPIKAAAAYTFSSYLYHMPLLALVVSGFHMRSVTALLMMTIGIGALAQVSEKQLPIARRILHRLVATNVIARSGRVADTIGPLSP